MQENDVVTIESTQDNKYVGMIDLYKYQERMKDKKVTCNYCKCMDLCGNGYLSLATKHSVRNKEEHPVWFCCECCCNMYKHEVGIALMDQKLYEQTLNKSYKKLSQKRK